MNAISRILDWFRDPVLPESWSQPLPPVQRDALKQRVADDIEKGAPSSTYEKAKTQVLQTLMTQKEKEAFIANHLKCPNCGATQFDEVCSNAALAFRCDCGLTFNFMPQLRVVDIVRDPQALR